jgi:hypothetical protein
VRGPGWVRVAHAEGSVAQWAGVLVQINDLAGVVLGLVAMHPQRWLFAAAAVWHDAPSHIWQPHVNIPVVRRFTIGDVEQVTHYLGG